MKRPYLLIFLLLGMTALAADERPTRERFLAFGEGRAWVLVEATTHRQTSLDLPEGFSPRGLTVSADGLKIAFTSVLLETGNTSLFFWERGSPRAPVCIGEGRGYHDDPIFSADGQWVYFAHNVLGMGAPTAHDPLRFAQLYRVRTDGNGLEAITSNAGCHFSPQVLGRREVILVHSSCEGTQALERIHVDSRKVETLGQPGEPAHELAVSPDGKWLLYTTRNVRTQVLKRVSLDGLVPPRTVATLPVSEVPVRPSFGASSNEVLYQSEGSVWIHDGREARPLFRMHGVQP